MYNWADELHCISTKYHCTVYGKSTSSISTICVIFFFTIYFCLEQIVAPLSRFPHFALISHWSLPASSLWWNTRDITECATDWNGSPPSDTKHGIGRKIQHFKPTEIQIQYALCAVCGKTTQSHLLVLGITQGSLYKSKSFQNTHSLTKMTIIFWLSSNNALEANAK